MIDYDPGTWHVAFIFRVHGSVFPKAFCWAFPSMALAIIIRLFVKVNPDKDISVVWSGYNFVLGFLIVFRSQQAYSRFWEGTTLLNQVRGEWFNAISSLFAFCTDKDEKQQDVKLFQHLIVRLMSLLYCSALQQVAQLEDEAFEVLDLGGLNPESVRFLMNRENERCEILLQWIQKAICININTGVITIAPPILSRVFQELSRGIVGVNNATKLSDILFPFPYAQMVSVMLLITTAVTPVVAGTIMQSAYWAGGLTFVSVFAFWSINYIAAEIELPFGEDANDLPIAEYQRTMNRFLKVLMEDQTQTPPGFTPLTPLTEECTSIEMRDDIVDHIIHRSLESGQFQVMGGCDPYKGGIWIPVAGAIGIGHQPPVKAPPPPPPPPPPAPAPEPVALPVVVDVGTSIPTEGVSFASQPGQSWCDSMDGIILHEEPGGVPTASSSAGSVAAAVTPPAAPSTAAPPVPRLHGAIATTVVESYGGSWEALPQQLGFAETAAGIAAASSAHHAHQKAEAPCQPSGGNRATSFSARLPVVAHEAIPSCGASRLDVERDRGPPEKAPEQHGETKHAKSASSHAGGPQMQSGPQMQGPPGQQGSGAPTVNVFVRLDNISAVAGGSSASCGRSSTMAEAEQGTSGVMGRPTRTCVPIHQPQPSGVPYPPLGL